MKRILLVLLFCVASSHTALHAQVPAPDDPCGFGLARPGETQRWGYDFSALTAHVQYWAMHPFVDVHVIGTSVQRRPLFELRITNPSSGLPKKRLWIHARTHPIEAEASEVARAVIDELLSGSPLATRVLDHCIVHVLPMLNPDGVVLRAPRENANGVDLESNWGSAQAEQEVAVLRSRLSALMREENPIEIALNLHSAYTCKRYFVYHAAAGSSLLFTQLQQRFIRGVREAFPGGIEPYDFFVTWTDGTPDRYPESWFWRNYGEKVMALTYEDMNCTAAGEYQRTARALLAGSASYLGIGGTVGTDAPLPAEDMRIAAAYPQPLHSEGTLTVEIAAGSRQEFLELALYDMLGRQVRLLWSGDMAAGRRQLQLSVGLLPAGSYLLLLRGRDGTRQQLIRIGA
ncbi:MAG: M14 family zinc carboxypeptidase [Bacteroidota bacterium]|nr:M14 family zinc carboxypeptidase [Bacteroidota bacterium]